MGLRGPGAFRLAAARSAGEEKPKRRAAWKKVGLSRAERVIAFLEHLPVTKGRLAGKRLRLLPGQRAFVEDIYGSRDVRMAIKSEPRGNGKTGLITGLALCHLLGPEAEPRGEVYSAAIDRQQAGIIFQEMEAIILAMPELALRVNIRRWHKGIEVLEGEGVGSIYEALSADARRAHGLAPSFWVYDELAQAKDRILLDNLETAKGKRARTLGMVISTQAASDDHPLSQLIDDGLRGEDPSTAVHLLAAPADADPFDVEVLKAVNPAWGVFLDEDELLRSMERARRIPAFEPAYRNLRLNQRIDANDERRVVTKAVWDLCAAPVDMANLEGKVCYGGLDLSGKHDLTALVLAFPDGSDGFDIVPFFWTPRGQLEARTPAERENFRRWIRSGHMIEVPGAVIEFRYVAEQIAALARRYRIELIGFDRWRIDDFRAELQRIGASLPLEPFGQGFKEMAPAVEIFAELAMTARLRHGGHPVLTACVVNAVLTAPDDAGNQKFAKGKANAASSVRIDGVVATAMALGVARRAAAKPVPQYQLFHAGA